MFTALGIPATLVSASDRLLQNIDGELAGLVTDEFQRRGVRLVLGAGADDVRRVDGRLRVTLSTGTVLDGDAVMVAAGRTPNTEGLGLEEAGVRLDNGGRILVDRYHRTTAPGIYAAGDVVKPGLASNAMQQGRARRPTPADSSSVWRSTRPRAAPYTAYPGRRRGGDRRTDPGHRHPYAVGRCDLATTPRGAIAGHGELLKLIFRADNRKLLGIHCFGDIASEVVGLGHVVLQPGGRVEPFFTPATPTTTRPSTA